MFGMYKGESISKFTKFSKNVFDQKNYYIQM